MALSWALASGAQSVTSGHRTLFVTLSIVVTLVTLGITLWSRHSTHTTGQFYTGGREFFAMQNGLALSGDFMSAASVLGITGSMSLYGFDGFLYAIGFLVGWVVFLLLIAEPMRNTGRFTLADTLSLRLRERPIRTAAAVANLTTVIFYLLAQMVGAGALVAVLLGSSGGGTKDVVILILGALMIVYVVLGGMKGITWVAITKTVLLLVVAAIATVLLLDQFGWNLSHLLGTAASKSPQGKAFLSPGLEYGKTVASRVDFVSQAMALGFGLAGLPHCLMRVYTVPTARTARKSVGWAIGMMGGFYLMTLVLGFGAAALVGPATIKASDPTGNTALILLAQAVGGRPGSLGSTVMLGIFACVAFISILAVVASLTLAASSSLAHDLYAAVIRKGKATELEELWAARYASIGIGAVAVLLSLLAQKMNVAFLVSLAIAMAGSSLVPTMLFALFWRRFTTKGAVWATYGGLIVSVTLVLFSPVVSGSPDAMFPGVDFQWFPLGNPGIVSIPLGFLFGWIGTLLSDERPDPAKFAEQEVRALTGAGAY
ncbi:solute symporter family protein [Actinacidiphila oryziradicis]|uniref:Cation acetate symporter n=1 Tax=Actinacidiphila oryziradicis TaxID=2571141 RepID=A0A4U0SHC3_9ACTN|nr:cation acetate symporter [Actinacidiphila oryziradicis]TKA08926.1 cation acetate symporter [Actinacidiphila oryziradicis]